MVATGMGCYPARQAIRIQAEYSVRCASNPEGAGFLKVLALKEKLRFNYVVNEGGG